MNRRVQAVAHSSEGILFATDGAELYAYDLSRRQPDNAAHYLRLPSVVYLPGQDVDTASEEPWASYYQFLGGGYADLVLDSDDKIYVSDPVVDRIWKFSAMRLSADRSEVTQLPLFEGWLGKCDENLDPTILACDTTRQQSIGFSCQDDLCGTTQSGFGGSAPGQFRNPRGIAMSPQDVLYVTDTGNFRVQRFTTDGYFAGEAVSECQGGCFVLGDFGYVTNVAVNSASASRTRAALRCAPRHDQTRRTVRSPTRIHSRQH
jgi:sugar lactone lactonase YvrE